MESLYFALSAVPPWRHHRSPDSGFMPVLLVGTSTIGDFTSLEKLDTALELKIDFICILMAFVRGLYCVASNPEYE